MKLVPWRFRRTAQIEDPACDRAMPHTDEDIVACSEPKVEPEALRMLVSKPPSIRENRVFQKAQSMVRVRVPNRLRTKLLMPTNIQKATKAKCCRSPATFSCCTTK